MFLSFLIMKGVFAMRISKQRVTVLLAALALSVFAVLVGVAWAADITYTGNATDLGTLDGIANLPKNGQPSDQPQNGNQDHALFTLASSIENNIIVNITNGSEELKSVFGGVSTNTDNSIGNTINLTSGLVSRLFIGGLGYPNSSGSISGNFVNVTGGRVGQVAANFR